jgi:hypothetical protein
MIQIGAPCSRRDSSRLPPPSRGVWHSSHIATLSTKYRPRSTFPCPAVEEGAFCPAGFCTAAFCEDVLELSRDDKRDAAKPTAINTNKHRPNRRIDFMRFLVLD